jgi:hypothetical protein
VATVKAEVAVFGEVTVTGFGLNAPVLFVGNPVTVKETGPLNEFSGVMVNGKLALVPALIVSTLVFAVIEKSGETTTNATEVVWVRVPSVPETVMV